jgi:glucan phosphoethanolaminetransferase (alkaline phosphatase superfamily)
VVTALLLSHIPGGADMVYLLTLFPIAYVIMTLRIIVTDTINYTEVDFLYIFLWPLGFCAILSLFLYKSRKEKNRRFLVSLGASIAAILFALFIDHFNIMIYRDKWFERGMPGPFEPSVMRKIEYPRELDVRYSEIFGKFSSGKISREEYDREIARIDDEIQKYKEQQKAKENDRN